MISQMPRLVRVENCITSPLEDSGFTMFRGWSDNVASQLVERSQESDMLEHVPRDHAERFVSRDRANEWYSEDERVVYALAGIAWFTRRPLVEHGADYTFAIRMYEKARGKGLAGAFMMAAHLDLQSHARYEGATWLETDEGNIHARRLYERYGYNEVSRADDRIRMIKLGSAPVRHASAPLF